LTALSTSNLILFAGGKLALAVTERGLLLPDILL
jgi:hypothetical protein